MPPGEWAEGLPVSPTWAPGPGVLQKGIAAWGAEEGAPAGSHQPWGAEEGAPTEPGTSWTVQSLSQNCDWGFPKPQKHESGGSAAPSGPGAPCLHLEPTAVWYWTEQLVTNDFVFNWKAV